MASESPNAPQRILLVTGLLGAGKTTALKVLEDLGWETIDNFPMRLLGRLLATRPSGEDLKAPLVIGFDSRTRGFDPRAIIEQVKRLSARGETEVTTLFLDCSGTELERRYNDTRRRHPMAQDRPVIRASRRSASCLSRSGAGQMWSFRPPIFPPTSSSRRFGIGSPRSPTVARQLP